MLSFDHSFIWDQEHLLTGVVVSAFDESDHSEKSEEKEQLHGIGLFENFLK
jgi:hypothetical protein